MCRYMGQYKDHMVCFSCRKQFKRRERPDAASLCPQCREPMRDLGLDFKPPRQQNAKQWRKVELLARHGITFHSCGCSGPGFRPATLRGAKEAVRPVAAKLGARLRSYSSR